MVIAMVLAHLVGDYVLQPDGMARWKREALRGVLAHALLVAVLTLAAALVVDPAWWPWALVIGAAHVIIDATYFLLMQHSAWFPKIPPLARFLIDQSVHAGVIVWALTASAELSLTPTLTGAWTWAQTHPYLLVGYVLLTMPAWVLIELLTPVLVRDAQPGFYATQDKYLSMLERALMATFVLVGQLPLALFVIFPRLILDAPDVRRQQQTVRYGTKLLLSVCAAIAVGLWMGGQRGGLW
jgi:hypothetical protein